jgi:hypothetical protein
LSLKDWYFDLAWLLRLVGGTETFVPFIREQAHFQLTISEYSVIPCPAQKESLAFCTPEFKQSSDCQVTHFALGRAAAAPSSSGGTPSLKPLVVVGSVNADIYVEVERLPKPGETLAAGTGYTLPGGKGANQAACAAKLGYPTYFVGQVR